MMIMIAAMLKQNHTVKKTQKHNVFDKGGGGGGGGRFHTRIVNKT